MSELLASLMEKISQHGLASVFDRYYSKYRAKVTDNKDPKKLGRIKVVVPSLFGEDPLPQWVNPVDFRHGGIESGEFFPPEEDQWVLVEFLEGDSRYPVYSGGWIGEDELGPEFQHDDEGAPQVRGYRDKWGNAILFDQTPDKQKLSIQTPSHLFILDDTKENEGIYLIHKTGAQFQVDKEGSVKAFSKDGNYVQLNAKDGNVVVGSKDGAIVSMKDNVVVSDSSGKSVVTISKDGVQITTGKDLILQSNSATLKTGSVVVDTGAAEVKYKTKMDIKGAAGEGVSLGTGQIALKGATAEVVDILLQVIQALSIAQTPGYGGPLSNAALFASLYALLLPNKKVG